MAEITTEIKDEVLDDSSDSSDSDDDDSSDSSSSIDEAHTITKSSSSSPSSASSSTSSSSSSPSSSSSENAGGNDSNNNSSEHARSYDYNINNYNNNVRECSPARVVSSDGIIVDMENHHSEPTDEGDMDLVVKDECNETHEESPEVHPRCYSAPLVKNEDTSAWKRAHSAAPYKYQRPDPVICAESVEIECLMHRAQFFLARACEENIKLAMKTSLWTTHPFTEKLLAEAFRRAPVVILVFLAKKADHFAGFAQMCSEALYKGQPAMRWVDFKGGGNIKLQWITKCPLALSATEHIKNPFNKEKVIFAASDGCEIQRAAGQRLCSLFPFDDAIDLKALKKKIRQKSKKSSNGLPSLLETEISYKEFQQAKRNLPIKKTIKDLMCEDRPPPMLLSSSRHESRDRKIYGNDNYSVARPLPLMDVSITYPSSASSTSWRKRRASPIRLSPKRRPLMREHRHRSRSTERTRRRSRERSSSHKYDSYVPHSYSKGSWRESSHEERDRHWRHSSRHRY